MEALYRDLAYIHACGFRDFARGAAPEIERLLKSAPIRVRTVLDTVAVRRINVSDSLPTGGMLIFDVIEVGEPSLTGGVWNGGEDWAVLVQTEEDPHTRTLEM